MKRSEKCIHTSESIIKHDCNLIKRSYIELYESKLYCISTKNLAEKV